MDILMIEKILYLLVLVSKDCWSLNLTGIFVPRYKLEGEEAVLECHYELHDKTLYAVKWFKTDEEFYRYVLRRNPPMTSYPVEGIDVDHTRSDSKRVVLRNLTPLSSGVYRCEVSAEAPSFSSATAAERMTVQHIPDNGPHIAGQHEQYLIGDEVSLNCTSGKSYPASVLHWYINDKEVDSYDEGLTRYPERRTDSGLITTHLGLDLRLMRYHFRKGRAEFRCKAIYPLAGEFPEGEALTAGGTKAKAVRHNNGLEAVLLVTLNASSKLAAASCQFLTAIATLIAINVL